MSINIKKFSKIVTESDKYIEKKCNDLIDELNKIYEKLSKTNDKDFSIDFYTYCVLIEKSCHYFSKYNKYSKEQVLTLIDQYTELESRFLSLLKDQLDPVQARVGYSRYLKKLENLIV